MFRLVNGSHGPRRITQTFMNQWDVRDISLRPGDCLIWRGDLTYMVTGGEGGEWAMFTFEWTQIDVDLTT